MGLGTKPKNRARRISSKDASGRAMRVQLSRSPIPDPAPAHVRHDTAPLPEQNMHGNSPTLALISEKSPRAVGFVSFPRPRQCSHSIFRAPPHARQLVRIQCPWDDIAVAMTVPKKHICDATPRMPLMSSSAPMTASITAEGFFSSRARRRARETTKEAREKHASSRVASAENATRRRVDAPV